MHVLADPTGTAQPVRDHGVQACLRAPFDGGGRRSDLLDDSRVLVAQGVRQGDLDLLLPNALDDVEVRVAHARSGDPHDHVRRILEAWSLGVDESERLVVSEKSGGLHSALYPMHSIWVFLSRGGEAQVGDDDRPRSYAVNVGPLLHSPLPIRIGTRKGSLLVRNRGNDEA